MHRAEEWLMRVVLSELAMRRVQDWSGCRSPSRARRRLAKGYRQRMVERDVPAAFMLQGALIVHPALMRLIEEGAKT